jgi:RIO kinase 2
MVISADHIRSLHPYEIRILTTLERLMMKHQWVPLDLIKRALGLSESEIEYRIGRLMNMGMVRYDIVPYEGYTLIFGGYDALALSTLSKRETVKALGCMIGEGKESVVYEAVGFGTLALKFHHVGQRSFHAVRQSREYLPESGHCPWIFASRYSAEREYAALKILHPHVRVPLPVDINRHVVVMEFIAGVNLNRCQLENPAGFRNEILELVRGAYQRGVIHADLSEFNVMVRDGECILIDWPQWVERDHPNGEAILRKDVDNILRYFKRKYMLAYDSEEALRCVMS